jgi:hypothetical protein
VSDKDGYLHWLEKQWEAYKFGLYGNTAHEDERTEEVLEMLKELGDLSARRIDVPEPPPRGESPG